MDSKESKTYPDGCLYGRAVLLKNCHIPHGDYDAEIFKAVFSNRRGFTLLVHRAYCCNAFVGVGALQNTFDTVTHVGTDNFVSSTNDVQESPEEVAGETCETIARCLCRCDEELAALSDDGGSEIL